MALSQEEILEVAGKVKTLLANESQGVGEIRLAESRDGLRSLPAFLKIGDDDIVVEAPLELLIGDTGKTPVLTFIVNAIEYGSKPTVTKTGTAEAPTITIGFPLAINGDKLVWKKTIAGIDVKYSRDPESAFTSLFTFADVMPDVSDFSEEGIKLLQKPATDAAIEVREQMVQIGRQVNEAIADTEEAGDRADTSAGEADQARISLSESVQQKLTEVDNKLLTVQDGKTTQFEIGTVKSGTTPSASLTDNGIDAAGNPKKKLNLVMEKGEKGDKGNTMYATFGFDPSTGELAMYTDEEYAGPSFELDNGVLSVTI